jgi:hypothetical protein
MSDKISKEELNKSGKEKQVIKKQEQPSKTIDDKSKEQDYDIKKGIRRLGNVLLGIIVILIVFSGALFFYLININPDAKTELKESLANNVVATENRINLGNVIDTAVSTMTDNNVDVNTVSTDAVGNRKVQNQDLIVLYDGLILDTSKMDLVNLKYIDNSSINKEKYVITYYNYENFGFKDSTLGILSDQVYDGLLKINKVGKLAISENYEAIPRAIKIVNSVPTIVADNNDKLDTYDLIKTIIADLDGNGTEEYILVLANTSTGYSKISLVDSKGLKVADLAYIEKSKWESISREEYHLSLSNLNVADVDNDGVMEILVEIPHYEGEPSISLIKYKNGELSGKTNIACSLLP